MFVLSASTTSFMDVTGLDIQMYQDVDQNGNPTEAGYQIVGYSFGYSLVLGKYPTVELAKMVFDDMLASIKKDKSFYDVRAEQEKFIGRQGQ